MSSVSEDGVTTITTGDILKTLLFPSLSMLENSKNILEEEFGASDSISESTKRSCYTKFHKEEERAVAADIKETVNPAIGDFESRINSQAPAGDESNLYGLFNNATSYTQGLADAKNAGACPPVREDALVYNEETRKWEVNPNPPIHIDTDFDLDSRLEVEPTADSESKSDTQSKTEKEYKEIEYNTLEGEVGVVPTSDTVKIKVGNTVILKGVGNYLSGLYYVSGVNRVISADGYSQTLTLIKTGFGDSLKKPSPVASDDTVKKSEASYSVGDKVKIVGDSAVYSNADDGVPVPGWVKEQELTVDAVSSDGTRVRLMPIWSWTYVKYIQKV